MLGYLKREIQTFMAQGRSTKIISMMKWIRTSRLSIKHSLSVGLSHLGDALFHLLGDRERAHEHGVRLDPVRGQPCVMLDGLHEHENATVRVSTNAKTQRSVSAPTRNRDGPRQHVHLLSDREGAHEHGVRLDPVRGQPCFMLHALHEHENATVCVSKNAKTQRSMSVRARNRNGTRQHERTVTARGHMSMRPVWIRSVVNPALCFMLYGLGFITQSKLSPSPAPWQPLHR